MENDRRCGRLEDEGEFGPRGGIAATASWPTGGYAAFFSDKRKRNRVPETPEPVRSGGETRRSFIGRSAARVFQNQRSASDDLPDCQGSQSVNRTTFTGRCR